MPLQDLRQIKTCGHGRMTHAVYLSPPPIPSSHPPPALLWYRYRQAENVIKCIALLCDQHVSDLTKQCKLSFLHCFVARYSDIGVKKVSLSQTGALVSIILPSQDGLHQVEGGNHYPAINFSRTQLWRSSYSSYRLEQHLGRGWRLGEVMRYLIRESSTKSWI